MLISSRFAKLMQPSLKRLFVEHFNDLAVNYGNVFTGMNYNDRKAKKCIEKLMKDIERNSRKVSKFKN